jgi:hypothetical protein
LLSSRLQGSLLPISSNFFPESPVTYAQYLCGFCLVAGRLSQCVQNRLLLNFSQRYPRQWGVAAQAISGVCGDYFSIRHIFAAAGVGYFGQWLQFIEEPGDVS